MRKGLVEAADREIRRQIEASDDAAVAARAAWRGVRSARAALRSALANAKPDDFAGAVEVDSAFAAVEVAEQRARRFGVAPGPYEAGGASLFRDLLAARSGDRAAQRRLDEDRSERELRTALGTDSSFVAPGYDTGAYADIPRLGRCLADLVPSRPLPKGRSVSVPRFSASASAGVTAQNTAPTETDVVDAYTTSTAAWIAGLLTVSLQLFERSWSPNFDAVAQEVLAAAFDEALEAQMWTGSGASGELLGVLNLADLGGTTYTSSSPTAAALLPVVGAAIEQSATARKALPTAIFMRPERWAWIAAGTDASDRPLLVPTGVARPMTGAASLPVGSLFGLPVYATAAIPANLGTGTNQDVIVVARPADMLQFSGEPAFDAFTDSSSAGSLTVALTMSGSVAFLPDRRPESIVAITGTGLAGGF